MRGDQRKKKEGGGKVRSNREWKERRNGCVPRNDNRKRRFDVVLEKGGKRDDHLSAVTGKKGGGIDELLEKNGEERKERIRHPR